VPVVDNVTTAIVLATVVLLLSHYCNRITIAIWINGYLQTSMRSHNIRTVPLHGIGVSWFPEQRVSERCCYHWWLL